LSFLLFSFSWKLQYTHKTILNFIAIRHLVQKLKKKKNNSNNNIYTYIYRRPSSLSMGNSRTNYFKSILNTPRPCRAIRYDIKTNKCM
jgi:hypothetical protein